MSTVVVHGKMPPALTLGRAQVVGVWLMVAGEPTPAYLDGADEWREAAAEYIDFELCQRRLAWPEVVKVMAAKSPSIDCYALLELPDGTTPRQALAAAVRHFSEAEAQRE